jgi:hypothetical protein
VWLLFAVAQGWSLRVSSASNGSAGQCRRRVPSRDCAVTVTSIWTLAEAVAVNGYGLTGRWLEISECVFGISGWARFPACMQNYVVLLPASPAFPGSGCHSFNQATTTAGKEEPLTSITRRSTLRSPRNSMIVIKVGTRANDGDHPCMTSTRRCDAATTSCRRH